MMTFSVLTWVGARVGVEELKELQKQFTESRTREILADAKETLRCLQAKLPKP
jgi:hypothetical protein